MSKQKQDILKLKELLSKIQYGYIVNEKEKSFIRKTLEDNLRECIEDVMINIYIDSLLIAVGDREFSESIFKKSIKNEKNQILEIGIGKTPILVFKKFGDQEYLKTILLNPEFVFTSEQKQLLLEEIGDPELVEKFLHDPSLGLKPEYKATLIEELYGDDLDKLTQYLLDSSLAIPCEIKTRWLLSIGNMDLIEKFIRDPSLGIKGVYRAYLITEKCNEDIEKIKEYIFDDSLKLESEAKTELAIQIGDIELIERLIKDSSLEIKSSDKVRLIIEAFGEDTEKIKQYIFDDSVKIEPQDIITLIEELDFEDAKEILEKSEIEKILDLKFRIIVADKIGHLDYIRENIKKVDQMIDKIGLVNLLENEDLVYEFLKKHVTETSDFNLLQLIYKITTPERLREFIEVVELQDKSGELIKHIAENLGDSDFLSKWNEEHVEITHITELTEKELKENKNIKYVVLKGYVDEYYSRDDYLAIRSKIDEIIKDIPRPKKDDLMSEYQAFKTIFKRLAHITYNHYAVTEEGDKDSSLARICRNLYGGLIDGTCVCKGYARILEECALAVGLEINTIGGDLRLEDGHAWNQIKIGGKWFNCDLTNYRELAFEHGGRNIYKSLQSNEEFYEYYEYYLDEYQDIKPCNTRFTELYLSEYVKKMAHLFGINEIKSALKNIKEKIKTFKDKLLHKTDEGR